MAKKAETAFQQIRLGGVKGARLNYPYFCTAHQSSNNPNKRMKIFIFPRKTAMPKIVFFRIFSTATNQLHFLVEVAG